MLKRAQNWIFLVGISAFGAVLLLGALLGTPYFLYIKIMTGKYLPEWYQLPLNSQAIYTPETYRVSDFPMSDDSPFWKHFPLGHFKLRISHRHPAIVPIPLIELDQLKRPILGMNFQDANGKRLLTFRPLRIEVFEYGLSETELFALPISRKLLKARDLETVWHEIFQKNLKEYQVGYKQLLFNLHTLYLRWKYFPQNFINFSYFSSVNIGLIELPNEDRDFSKYYVMKLHRGKLVTFELEVRKDHPLSKNFSEKLLSEIEYAPSYPEIADELYREFKGLKFQEQTGEHGFLLLYSAYSHRPKSAAFFRELVRYLERQEKRPPQLPPLYDFGFNYFGSNFSTLEEERRETEEMALKRRMEEELEKEMAKYESMRLQRGEFKDSKEKMDYQLQEAKNKKSGQRKKEVKGTVDGTITFE